MGVSIFHVETGRDKMGQQLELFKPEEMAPPKSKVVVVQKPSPQLRLDLGSYPPPRKRPPNAQR